jgi:hypothetical protein
VCRIKQAEHIAVKQAERMAALEAFRRFWGMPRFDLLQVHNLLSWEGHLRTLLAMKAAGRLRYVGTNCRLHRSLHPNCDRPCVQRRSSAANMKLLGSEATKRGAHS